jgi:hypothetical protein
MKFTDFFASEPFKELIRLLKNRDTLLKAHETDLASTQKRMMVRQAFFGEPQTEEDAATWLLQKLNEHFNEIFGFTYVATLQEKTSNPPQFDWNKEAALASAIEKKEPTDTEASQDAIDELLEEHPEGVEIFAGYPYSSVVDCIIHYDILKNHPEKLLAYLKKQKTPNAAIVSQLITKSYNYAFGKTE